MNLRIGSADQIPNPIAILARKWAVEVILTLGDRTLRFNALKKEVKGVTAKSLTEVLRQMQNDALVRRNYFPVIPPRVEYSLSPLGLELLAAFGPLQAFVTRRSLVSS